MKPVAPLSPAVAAFFAAKRQPPPAAAPYTTAPTSAEREAPTEEWWNRMVAVGELRAFLDACARHDAIANDNGSWSTARRASAQPALRALRYRTA